MLRLGPTPNWRCLLLSWIRPLSVLCRKDTSKGRALTQLQVHHLKKICSGKGVVKSGALHSWSSWFRWAWKGPLSPRLDWLQYTHATRDWHWVHVSYRRIAHSMAHPARPLLTASSWPIRIVTFTGRTRHSAQTKFDFDFSRTLSPFLFYACLNTRSLWFWW